MAWVHHDSHGQTTIVNEQALGPESPLETDEDGYAEVEDDEVAELLAAMDAHVGVVGPPGHGTSDESDEFDAGSFVDRTPMEEVISDIESGDYDGHLDVIEAAEVEDRGRTGVANAIADRREQE